MTDKQTPPDWALIEAAKRGKRLHLGPDMLRIDYATDKTFRALCDMIERYEQPPVDRKLLCAREVVREWTERADWGHEAMCIRAIELFEEGFGK
jgi:non-ribosomal peptide synthetase component F